MKAGPNRRPSRQRSIVLEELQADASHPTARELYDRVRKRLPRISLGTVYRNLQSLCGCGEAIRLTTPTGESRFDADPAPHDHVRCVRCGCVADVPGPAKKVLLGELDEAAGFGIIGYRLEYLGVCPACRAAEPKRPGIHGGRVAGGLPPESEESY